MIIVKASFSCVIIYAFIGIYVQLIGHNLRW